MGAFQKSYRWEGLISPIPERTSRIVAKEKGTAEAVPMVLFHLDDRAVFEKNLDIVFPVVQFLLTSAISYLLCVNFFSMSDP